MRTCTHAGALHGFASRCHVTTDLNKNPPSASPPQEELLLSILPKHIADEMLQGMKDQAQQQEVQQQQFNTMYMYRHENVRWGSFLFYHRGLIVICRMVLDKWQILLLLQYPVCRHCWLHPAVLSLQRTGACKAAQ